MAAAASSSATAQAALPATPAPAARVSDVSSPDAIVAAVYDVISGPGARKRDWNRLRSLFVPGARVVHTGKDGVNTARVMGVEDYIQAAGPFLEGEGFFEREVHRVVDRYGDIAQAFSIYESRHATSDAKPFQRGINSFQLMCDGRRLWVVTIYRRGERPDRPIPKRFGG